MPNEENLLKVYNALNDEYDLGSYDDFKVKMEDSNNRSKLWSAANSAYDLGDFNSFEQRIGYGGGLGKPLPGSEAGPSGGRRLPSKLSGQQVKSYLGKYGASFTDQQYDQIAQQAAGKSFEEAMNIARNITTPTPVAPTPVQMAPLEAGRQMLASAAEQRTGLAEEVQQEEEPKISGYLSPEQLQGAAMEEARMPSATMPTIEQKKAEFATQFRQKGEVEAADVVSKMSSDTKKRMLALYAEDAKVNDSDELDLGPFGTIKVGETPEEAQRNLDQLISFGEPSSIGFQSGFNSQQIYDKLKSDLGYENDKKLEEDLLKYFISNQGLVSVLDDSKQKLSSYTQAYEAASQDPQSSPEELVELKKMIDKELKIQEMGFIVEGLQYRENVSYLEGLGLSLAYAGYDAGYLAEGLRLSVNELTTTLLENTIEPIFPESWKGVIRDNLVSPVLYSRKKIREEQAELPYQSVASQSVIDGLNLINVARTGTQIAGSIGVTAAGGIIGFMAGGPVGAERGATLAAASLTYGEAADEARKAGASEAETQAYALLGAYIDGTLEKFGLKGLTKTIVTDAERRYVLSAIKSELKKGASVEKVVSSIVNRVSNAAGSLVKAGTPEAGTEFAQTGKDIIIKKGFNEFILEETDKKFEEPTIDEAGRMLAESLVTGFFGASSVPAGISLLARGNTKYEAAANAVVSGKKKVSDIVETTKALIISGKVSAADGRAFIENLKIAEAAKASLPVYVKDKQQRTRAISLMMERNKLNEEMKTADPDLQSGYKDRLNQIKEELKSIADKKWEAPTNPFTASTLPGFSAAISALSNDTDKDKSARVFNQTLTVNNGLLTKLAKAMESGTEIARELADSMSAELQYFADALSSSANQTPAIQQAIKSARDMSQRLGEYTNKRENVSDGKLPSMNMDDIIGRIAAGAEPGDMDFMENVSESILDRVSSAISGILDGLDVSEKDAAYAADFLYDRYKQLTDLKAKIQQRINNETNQTKKDRLNRSLSAISEAQSKLNEDISTTVKYQQEKALRDEAAGTRTEPVASPLSGAKQEAAPQQEVVQAQEYDPANEQDVVDDFNSKNEDQLLPSIVKAINSVAKLLAKIAPEVKFYVHTTTQDFVNALVSEGVDAKDIDRKDGGKYLFNRGTGKAFSVHINLEVVNKQSIELGRPSKAIYHEAAHVILNKFFSSDPRVIKDMLNAVTKVIPKGVSKQIDKFITNYEGDTEEDINEERIAELVEILANTEQQLDDTTISKIIKAINDFITKAANALGVQNVDRFLISDSRADFIEFVNSMARSTASGIQEISTKQAKRIQKKFGIQEQAEPAELAELANEEATTKALVDIGIYGDNDQIRNLVDKFYPDDVTYEELSNEYHKAKRDGSNPELVNAIEKLITESTESKVSTRASKEETKQKQKINEKGAVRPERARNRARSIEGGSYTPLEGAPLFQGASGPDPRLVAVADKYAKENGIDLKRQSEYVKVDVERAKRIAQAYEDMINDPQNPVVREAYKDLVRQTLAQFKALQDAGYEFTFFDSETDPYNGNPVDAMRDLRQNQRMAVYGTYDGYGTEGITESELENNPMLEDTGLRWKDQNGVERPVVANDLFRAVHDVFGHGLEGTSFRARGEENAWQAHVRLFTGPAIAALTTETRGQNSWLNYGPYGESNRGASVNETVFAENKIGLLPEWTWTEGRAGDMAPSKQNVGTKASKAEIVDKVQSQVSPGKTVGTRNPTGKSATEKGSDPNALITLDAMRRDEKTYKNNATLVASYPIVSRDIPKSLRDAIKKAQAPINAIEARIAEKKLEIDKAKKDAVDLIKAKALKINKKISVKEAQKELAKILEETSPSAGMARAKNNIKNQQNRLDELNKRKKELEDAYSKKVQELSKSMTIKTADKIFDALVKATKDNLESLINLFPKDIRDIAKLWYDGANIIAQDFASKYQMTKEQSSAVLAVFSPQKDWFMNISLAERAMNVWKNMQDYTIDANMERQMIMRAGYPQIESINDDGTIKYTGGAQPLLDQDGDVILDDEGNPIFKNWDQNKAKENKELAMIMINQMRGVPLKDLPINLQARFIRMHSEVYDSPSFNIYRPDGVIGGPSKTEKGNNRNIAWGGYNTIEKAIRVMSASKADMMEVISTELGDQHKVRSFYNNIVDPSNKNGHVTMDTHAIAAVLWKALSGNSKEVTQNFGGAGTSSNSNIGSKGLYAAFAKAYSEAASELGYLPREIQSITWEAVRMLFTAKWKSQKVNLAKIDAIWNEYATNLDITMAQVRDEIFKLATKSKYNGTKSIEQAINDGTGVGRPDWAEVYDSELSTEGGEKTYDKIQLSPGGGVQYGRGRGDGGPGAVNTVAELVPGATKGRESRDLGVTVPLKNNIGTKASRSENAKYDPDDINQTKPQLDLQTRIYDAASDVWEEAKTKGEFDKKDMIWRSVLDATGIELSDIQLATLSKDLLLGKRPEYKRSGTGKYERVNTRKGRSAVLTRVVDALQQMVTDRRVNKSIMSSLLRAVNGDTTYTVENQVEAMMIVDEIFKSVNGVADIETGNALLALAMNAKGGIRAEMFARLANEAWDKARASKDYELREAYRQLGNMAIGTLSSEATEAGRFNSIIYRIKKMNPEFIVQFEADKVRNKTWSDIRDANKQGDNVASAANDLTNAQAEAAQEAAQAPSVQSAVNAATGAPNTQPQTPPSQNAQVDKRIKELKNLLKNKFGGTGTRAMRTAPAGLDPDILDIITELAENYIRKGITDPTALIAKVNADVVAAGGSLNSGYYNQMWSNVSASATAMKNDMNASKLAGRIVGRVKQRIMPSPVSFDPIAELIDELLNKATEDMPAVPPRTPEPRIEKLTRLISQYYEAKDMWESSKAKVEQRIDDLDPIKFSYADKQAMKDMLDKFFANDLSYFEIKQTPTPGANTTVDKMIREQMKEKKIAIEKILLEANTKQAQTKDEFIDQIVADIVAATGITSTRATAIARSFADQYDRIVTKKQESIIKKKLPVTKSFNKFRQKSTAQRAFEAIKYGMIDPSVRIYDDAGNIIDTTKLFCEMFGIPYLDSEMQAELEKYAEAIAEAPPGILRNQVLNDMAMYIKMQQYLVQGSIGERFVADYYAKILTSVDSLMKAFNSNILVAPFEYTSQVVRAAAKGDFSLIPLLTRAYYGEKGVGKIWTEKATQDMTDSDGYDINQGEDYYKLKDGSIISLANPKVAALSGQYEGLLRYRTGINSARLMLRNIVIGENYTDGSVSEVYRKYGTKSGRVWGTWATLASRGFAAIDAMTTAAATQARFGDLIFDAVNFYAKEKKIKISGTEIADIVNRIQGNKPLVQLDALNTAIAEMKEKYGDTVNLNDKAKKALLFARVEEIVKEKMSDRRQQAVSDYPWLSMLDDGQLSDMFDMAYDVASKIGMMGTPPGTGGMLTSLLAFPGKYIRFSNIQYGTFRNAPINAAMFILQGNTPIATLITAVRLAKGERGLSLGLEWAENQYKNSGIRVQMYGKSKGAKFKWNLEKQDILTKFLLIQGPVVVSTYMAANAIIAALASTFDDDDDEKEKLMKDGAKAIGSIDQGERLLKFFGDRLSKDPKKREGVWKSLPFYATGAIYGMAKGGYAKTMALKSTYGIEPYTVYAYGKKMFSYRDNPALGAFFMQMSATTDAMLFTEKSQLSETQHGIIMASTFAQLNLIKDQSNLRSIAELTEFFSGQRAYEGADGFIERGKLYLSKTSANIVNNAIVPAEIKNLNQDINAILGNYMDDPRTWLEMAVYRWPILSNILINKDKTGPFGFPLEVEPKRVFPIGLEQFKLPLMEDGTLEIPDIDKLLSSEDKDYVALFMRNESDKFLNPDMNGYYKLNDYKEFVRETFTDEQRKMIRDEYKIVMREFAEKNMSVNTPAIFDTRLNLFLNNYKRKGYKRYILNKVLGEEAKSVVIDESDGIVNMKSKGLILQKLREAIEDFEPRD